jgi:hypothetical protein
MKKLLALSALFMLLAATAFAQFKVELNADIYPELIKAAVPLGDNKDKGSGTFGFLTEWGTWYKNELRLTLKYTDPDGSYSGYIRFRGDGFIQPNGYSGINFFNNAGDNNGGGVTATALLLRDIDEYALTGKLGIFSAYFGNGANRGKVNRFTGLSNFLDGSKIDNYGLMKPKAADPAKGLSLDVYDVNNFRLGAPNNKVTYLSGTVDLKPITVGIAGSVFEHSPTSGASWSRGNAALRVSGADIADLLTFDVLYKVNAAPVEGSGSYGKLDNDFGVYANIAIPGLDSLGLGIGYSGYVQLQEEVVNPLFSGVDLRAKFTGIDDLTISLNNNISFAGAKGTDSSTQTNKSALGSALLKDVKESFFALYNGLLVTYQLTDIFTARFEAANRFASLAQDSNGFESKFGYELLQLEIGGIFTLNSHVGFEGGLALQVDNSTAKVTVDGTTTGDVSAGAFTFGIPLRMHIVF